MESPEIYIGLSDIQAQRRFFQLPLVCRRFRDVFLGSVDLPQVLVIQQNLSESASSSLKTWLQPHAAHLQSITSLCADNRTIETLLALLATSHLRLTSASCVINSNQQLAALGCLRHLTACTLQTSLHKVALFPGVWIQPQQPTQWLDLTPLQCLPSLQSLVLKNGRFLCLSAVTRLTSLSTFQCHVKMGYGKFDMPLEKLFISESLFTGFGSRELSSCQSLEHLTLIDCSLKSAFQEQSDICISARDDKTIIPADLSEMTGLKALHVSVFGGQAKALTLDWLYHLIHLERLKLVHQGKLILSEGMGALSKLMSMSIDCGRKPATGQPQPGVRVHSAPVHSAPHTVLSFDWHKLGALRHLEVFGDFVVDLKLLNLTTLRHVQSISFEGHPWNRSSVSAFAIFMYRLAALRSDIQVKIHGADALLSNSIESVWEQYVVPR